MGKLKIKGRVIRVIDGDTLEVAVPVRMHKIDAPELKNPLEKELGIVAKNWLQGRVANKPVMMEFVSNDIYYRGVADVYESGSNVGEEMLDKGLVEVYSSKKHNDGVIETIK